MPFPTANMCNAEPCVENSCLIAPFAPLVNCRCCLRAPGVCESESGEMPYAMQRGVKNAESVHFALDQAFHCDVNNAQYILDISWLYHGYDILLQQRRKKRVTQLYAFLQSKMIEQPYSFLIICISVSFVAQSVRVSVE